MAIVSRGLDRSHFQGTGDPWSGSTGTKARYHLTWGACKATESAGFVDSAFAWNWADLKKAGMTRVAYHFAHPDVSAAAQADHFLSVVKPVVGDVLCLDLERGTTQAATNKWAKTFLARCRSKAPGVALVIYMGTGYAGTQTGAGMSDFADYWWVARYPGLRSWPTTFDPQLAGNTTGWTAPHIWQWTDSFAGKYDANVSTLSGVQIATPKGTDMPLTPADCTLLLNTVIPNPRDPNAKVTLASWIKYGELRTEDNGKAIAALTAQNVALAAQVEALTQGLPDLVHGAVNAAIASGLVTVQINAKETP